MLAVIGATGNVGHSTVTTLLARGAPVRAVLRDRGKAAPLEALGCEIAVADLQRPAELAEAIAGADAVQVVVPLRMGVDDQPADMRRSIASLVEALVAARPPRVLAISDYGAHVTEDIGMPSLFHELEARLAQFGGGKIILRSAEHMHNLARGVVAALESGTLSTFQEPLEKPQPMIAAQDLGRVAADLLLGDSAGGWEVVHAEGPRRYSANDAAAALSELAGRRITAQSIPRSAWQAAMKGMPPGLADLLTGANDAKNRGGLVDVEPGAGQTLHGRTELIDALRELLPRA